MEIIENNNLVSVGQDLVRANYKLTLQEQRLILFFISRIDNRIRNEVVREKVLIKGIEVEVERKKLSREGVEIIDEKKLYCVGVKEFADFFNIDFESAKDELKVACERLFEQKIRWEKNDGGIVTSRWVQSMVEYKEDHYILLRWAVEIIPLLSNLRGNFLSYKINVIKGLRSFYAVRWYMLLLDEVKQQKKYKIRYGHWKHRVIWLSVQQIKDMFCIDMPFGELNRGVIEKPMKEITRKTDLNISLVDENRKRLYRKDGKRVVEVGVLAGFGENLFWVGD